MNRKLKKISAFAAAAVLAAGVCSAVPAEGGQRNISQLSVSAAETDISGNVRIYGTSTTAVINAYAFGNKYTVYLYDTKTKKYKKYKENVKLYESTEITGLKANTKYKVKVDFFSYKDGKSVKTASKTVTFTTKKSPRGKTVRAEDGTVLSPKRQAYFDLRSKYCDGMFPEKNKTYLIACDNSGVNMFGCLQDPLDENAEREYGFYTYITHDGIADILPVRGYNFKSDGYLGVQYVKNIDSDKEPEIVSVLPYSSGAYYSVGTLTVYDRDSSGHYREHTFPIPDSEDGRFEKLTNKNVKFRLDKNKGSYTISSLNSDAVYKGKTDTGTGRITDMSFDTTVCGFYSDDSGRLYMSMLPESEPFDYLETVPYIISEVVYDGKDFSLKNTRFEDQEQ